MNDFQSALDPAGPQAGAIASLWWTLFAVASLVWLAVVVALVRGTVRAARRTRESDAAFAPLVPEQERHAARAVATAIGATVVVLLGFLVLSVRTGRAITRSPDPAGELVVEAARRSGHRNVRYSPSWKDAPAILLENVKEGDVIVTLGAGDVNRLGKQLVEEAS